MAINYKRFHQLREETIDRHKGKIVFFEQALKYTKHSKRTHVIRQKIKYYQQILKMITE